MPGEPGGPPGGGACAAGPGGGGCAPGPVTGIEQHLLGGAPRHTRAEVAAAAGLPAERARELWRALGFASVADDERAFTDADVAALERLRRLSELLPLDDDLVRTMTRMLGRSFSRLASWQGQLLAEALERGPGGPRDGADPVAGQPERLAEVLADVQELQAYVWRRQLAAHFSRAAPGDAPGDAPGATRLTVGFADMAQFTALTRRSSEGELRAVLDAFEALATEVTGARGGRIVKTLGDEVLFVAHEPVDGVEIALGLLAGARRSAGLPALRVGLASGPVVLRMGDVFGQTVNIASRLTSVARPGSVLVDEQLADALSGRPDRYRLRALRAVSVRGYRHLHPWLLRPAGDPDHD